MTKETWVTTLDNPFDPFSEPENWKRFDEDHKYFTTALICRFLKVSDDFDQETYNQCLEDAVNEIVRFNFTGNYRKVVNENGKAVVSE